MKTALDTDSLAHRIYSGRSQGRSHRLGNSRFTLRECAFPVRNRLLSACAYLDGGSEGVFIAHKRTDTPTLLTKAGIVGDPLTVLMLSDVGLSAVFVSSSTGTSKALRLDPSVGVAEDLRQLPFLGLAASEGVFIAHKRTDTPTHLLTKAGIVGDPLTVLI